MSDNYEFWDEESKYYAKFFSRMFQEDLEAIWQAISKKVRGKWLDIGSGDGSSRNFLLYPSYRNH